MSRGVLGLFWGIETWRAPYFHSPSTLLEPVGTYNTELSNCTAKTGRHALALCSPIALLKSVGMCSPYGVYSMVTWLWWPGGLVFLGHSGLKQLERVPGRILPSQNCTGSRQTHLQSSSEKGPFTCPEASAWRADFRFATHLEATVLLGSKEWGTLSLSSPLLSLLIINTTHKGAYILIWNPYFLQLSPSLSGPETSRVYNFSSIGLYIFAYFKRCFLSAWFPISLKNSYWPRSLRLEHWQVLAHA